MLARRRHCALRRAAGDRPSLTTDADVAQLGTLLSRERAAILVLSQKVWLASAGTSGAF